MTHNEKRLDAWTILALVATLVVYPALYCSGFMGPLVRGIFAGDRSAWWMFFLANLAFHWVPFALIAWALWRNREPWSTIGVDWSWFWRQRLWMATALLLLVAAALSMPGIHYGDSLPSMSQSHFLAPVSAAERLMMILIAVTAGMTEEVLFRGFPLTRLGRIIPSPWLILPLTVVSFLFIHGTPRSVPMLVAYTAAGLAFGVPFILIKLRRLELLILIHFAIDAAMVLAP